MIGLGQLKGYAMIGLSIALAVVYALFNKERASRYMEKAKTAQGASKALSEANTARAEAERRGKERLDEKDPTRNHFS